MGQLGKVSRFACEGEKGDKFVIATSVTRIAPAFEAHLDPSTLSRTKHPTVLLTEGASLSARHTLYGLGPHYTIDVIDPDPLCQCRFSRFVRRWTRSPSFSSQPEEFLRFLARQIRDHRYDVVLPTHEQVYLLSRFRAALDGHTGVALPPFESLERLQNKAEFCRLLSELDLPQPEVTFVRTRADFDRQWEFPFYLKLSHSTAVPDAQSDTVVNLASGLECQMRLAVYSLYHDDKLVPHDEAVQQLLDCGKRSDSSAP